MSESIIQVNNLSKMYKLYEKKSDRVLEAIDIRKKSYHKPFYALSNISFDVKKGETVGIIGTNGSGKSTLLKILTGVATQTSGSFEVKGKVSALLELGAGFNPEYTGLENIDLHGMMMGYTKEEMLERREGIIRFADIGDYIKQPVKNYSSGMFARLAFSVAISIEPEILIVDEALSVGDVFFQSKCFKKFEELREKGTSILFVSHDTATVRKMCSRVLWIEKGKQMMYGESDEVCKAYFKEEITRRNKEMAKVKEENGMDLAVIGNYEDTVKLPRIKPQGESILSEAIEVVSVFFKDTNGVIVNQLYAGETYSLCVVSKAKVHLDDLIVGFYLVNRKGVNITGDNTYADGKIKLEMKKDSFVCTEFTLTIPQIRSDKYTITVAVAQGTQNNHVILTWLHGVTTVEIIRYGYELAELGLDCTIKNTELKEISFI